MSRESAGETGTGSASGGGSEGRVDASGPAGGVAARVATLRRYDALVVVSLVWFLAKLLRYAFPPLFGPLQSEYGVSTAFLGTAYGGLMAAYAAMQFPSGALADRLGPVPVVVAGAGVAAVGAAIVGWTAALPLLVVGMVVFGVGSGAHKTVAVRLVSRAYPRRPGRALGVMDTLGAAGGLVGPAVAVALLPAWRGLYLATAVAAVVLAVGVTRVVPRRLGAVEADEGGEGAVENPRDRASTERAQPAGGDANEAGAGDDPADDRPRPGSGSADRGRPGLPIAIRSYLAPFRDRRFTAFALSAVPFTFATGGAFAFLPLFFERVAGQSTAAAGTLYSAVFVGAVAQLATGELGDRVGHLPVAVGTTALAAVALAVVATAPPLVVLAAAAVAFGAGLHGLIPVRGAYMMRVLPDETAAGSLGVVRTLFMGASAVAPAVVGVVADTAGLAPAVWLLVGVAAVSVVPAASLLWTGAGVDGEQ